MPVQHLLKQVESYRSKRNNRDVRPEWVSQFIDHVADLFEPTTDVARVGFDCRMSEHLWEVGMYLGSTEIVGGKADGQSRHCNFQFDLHLLLDLFDQIEQFNWSAFPDTSEGDAKSARSFVTIEGLRDNNPIRLHVYSIPPSDAGPGFRQFPNGERNTV